MDQIKTMLDSLTELGEDQLADLQTAIVNEFETVEKEDPTPQTVDAMTSLADMLDTVRGEIKGRAAAAEELAARAAEAAMRVKGQEDVPAEDVPADEMPAVPAPTAPLTLCSARPLLCSPTALFTQCSAYPLLTLAAVAECWLLGGWVVLAGWQQWLAVGLAGYAKPPGWLAGCSPVPLPVAGCPPAGYFIYLTSYTVMYLYLS